MGFIDKNLQNCDKPYFYHEENREKQHSPYFHVYTTANKEWGRENMGFVIVFEVLKIYKSQFYHIFGVWKSECHDFHDNECPRRQGSVE